MLVVIVCPTPFADTVTPSSLEPVSDFTDPDSNTPACCAGALVALTAHSATPTATAATRTITWNRFTLPMEASLNLRTRIKTNYSPELAGVPSFGLFFGRAGRFTVLRYSMMESVSARVRLYLNPGIRPSRPSRIVSRILSSLSSTISLYKAGPYRLLTTVGRVWHTAQRC